MAAAHPGLSLSQKSELRCCLQVQASLESVNGLGMTPDEQHVFAAAEDGNLTLLDIRKGGTVVSKAPCSTPLLCCQADGQTAVAGGQNGQVSIRLACQS